jgi:APA family basic amino acid/polyamine antiporter
MFGLPLDTWLRLAAWFAIGIGIYLFYGVRHSRVQREKSNMAPQQT